MLFGRVSDFLNFFSFDKFKIICYTDNQIIDNLIIKKEAALFMAVPDHSIDPRIWASARKEFLEKGFEKASLKEICEGAGVTTGALYKRYKGKEELFCAVVEQTVQELYAVANARGNRKPEELSDSELIQCWDMDGSDMMWWFQFLYDRHDDFVLLLSCAEGTRYSNFQHDWVATLTKATTAFLAEAQRRDLCRKDVGPEELHILLTAFWTTIYEPFIHHFTWKQMEEHCRIVCHLFDWHGALAFRIPE